MPVVPDVPEIPLVPEVPLVPLEPKDVPLVPDVPDPPPVPVPPIIYPPSFSPSCNLTIPILSNAVVSISAVRTPGKPTYAALDAESPRSIWNSVMLFKSDIFLY